MDDIKQTLAYLPKIEPDEPSPSSPPVPLSPIGRRNPPRVRAPPQRLKDYHLFTTVAEDVNTSFPYTDASGRQVDLAISDENHIAHVCHYVMLHCAESSFIGNPNNKKQYGLKAGLQKFAERGNDVIYGTVDNDILIGNDGNDILEGLVGHDILVGGLGDDQLLMNGRLRANNADHIMLLRRQ